MRKALYYGAVLIGIYLAVDYATGASNETKAASSGVASVIKSLQGR